MSDLLEKTLFEEIDKVQTAIKRLKEFEPDEGYYLAFSGGKDSVVIKALADMAGVKYDAHYAATGIDYPELVRFIKEYYPDVNWVRPKKPFFLYLQAHGFPTRLRRWCCHKLKEGGGKGRLVVTGIRWAESLNRKKRRMVEACNQVKGKHYLHVIIDWSAQNVWDFIRKYEIPYCKLYDEGFKRLGCAFCPMQSPWIKERDRKRWPRLDKVFRRAFNKLFDKRTSEDNEAIKRWKSGDEMYDWWMSNDPLPSKDKENGLFT